MHGREGLNHVHHLLSPFRPERPTRCTQYSISTAVIIKRNLHQCSRACMLQVLFLYLWQPNILSCAILINSRSQVGVVLEKIWEMENQANLFLVMTLVCFVGR